MHNRRAQSEAHRHGAIGSSLEGRRLIVALLAAAVFAGLTSTAQQPKPPGPDSIILPEANRPPDANARMRMDEKRAKQKNFDAANALRTRQIDDAAAKLLILARDLKAQMDKVGNNPLPDRILREAEVIELLARDVQNRMTLTVGGG